MELLLKSGITLAAFHSIGTEPDCKDKVTILANGLVIIVAASFNIPRERLSRPVDLFLLRFLSSLKTSSLETDWIKNKKWWCGFTWSKRLTPDKITRRKTLGLQNISYSGNVRFSFYFLLHVMYRFIELSSNLWLLVNLLNRHINLHCSLPFSYNCFSRSFFLAVKVSICSLCNVSSFFSFWRFSSRLAATKILTVYF